MAILLRFVLDVVRDHGYLALFALQAPGILALPLPDEILVMFAGYLSYKGELRLELTIFTAFLGSSTGITLSYVLGRMSSPLFRRLSARLMTPQRIERTHAWFVKTGKCGLTLGYFLPGIRHLIGFAAGSTKLRPRTFALYAYAGTLLWSCAFAILGYALGEQWAKWAGYIHWGAVAAAGLAIAIAIALWAWRRR